jgi:hypothetical protein
VDYIPRSGWAPTAIPERKLKHFDAAVLRGVAVHYTGSTSPLGETATLAQSVARLRAELTQHTKGNGWTDIAYNFAIDEAGRVFELRGLECWSAANGDPGVNAPYAACTFLIGVGDKPTPAAIQAFHDWREGMFLKRWPRAVIVVGHRDLHSTECPGAPLYALVHNGSLAKGAAPALPAPKELSMTPTVQEIADELFSDRPDGAYYKVHRPDGSLAAIPTALAEMYALLERIAAKVNA